MFFLVMTLVGCGSCTSPNSVEATAPKLEDVYTSDQKQFQLDPGVWRLKITHDANTSSEISVNAWCESGKVKEIACAKGPLCAPSETCKWKAELTNSAPDPNHTCDTFCKGEPCYMPTVGLKSCNSASTETLPTENEGIPTPTDPGFASMNRGEQIPPDKENGQLEEGVWRLKITRKTPAPAKTDDAVGYAWCEGTALKEIICSEDVFCRVDNDRETPECKWDVGGKETTRLLGKSCGPNTCKTGETCTALVDTNGCVATNLRNP